MSKLNMRGRQGVPVGGPEGEKYVTGNPFLERERRRFVAAVKEKTKPGQRKNNH